jgi:hypothetical protein
MKYPKKWHTWPQEVPPEDEPLRIEAWNAFHKKYELVAGIFRDGEFLHHDPSEFTQRIFFHEPERVFWRLWEGEDEECSH